MTRSIQRLALLVSSTIAVAALTVSAAWAGDRYGATDGRAGEYAASDYGYQSDAEPGRADYDGADGAYGDSRRDVQSSRSRSEYERSDSRSRVYSDERVDDVEQVDPCAVQYRLTGRRCLGDRVETRSDERIHESRPSRRDDDLEQIDPCAVHYHLTGHRCGADKESYRDGRVSRDTSSWRSERAYSDESASAYDRFDDADGYVDACVVAHERLGDRCPYAGRRSYRDRVVWVEERLPDSFFISEGGVGPGIVDFGESGGGGGFVFSDSFANASASASARAQASVSLSIAAHNRHMMGHPHKMHGGCGCKKGY